MSTTATTALFHPKRECFAFISNDNRLKVWDVESQNIRQDYVEKEHLSQVYTTMAWSETSPWAAITSASKKKKRDHQPNAALGLIALGTVDGTIIVWDLQQGAVVQRLSSSDSAQQSAHRSNINSLVFNSTGSLLYSCADDKFALEWDVKSGKVLRSFKGGKEGIKSLALSRDDATLATGNSSIKLWDLSSGKRTSRLASGHSSQVSSCAFSPCGKYLFSSARGGRFVNVYEWANNSSEPLVNFSLDSCPSTFFGSVTENCVCTLGAVSDAGKLYLWNTSLPKTNAAASGTPIQPTLVSSEGSTVLSAMFNEDNSSLLIAQGTYSKPSFVTKSFVNASTGVFVEGVLELEPSSNNTLSVLQVEKQSTKKQKQDVHVVAVAERGTSKAPIEDMMMVAASNADAMEIATDDEEEIPLAERIQSLREAFEDQDEEDDGEGHELSSNSNTIMTKKPQASSLVTVLEQALQSNDNSMLEYVLRVTDTKVIDATMQRLPSVRVLSFLNRVVDKLEKRPTRGSMLCRWIRSILMNHTSYLMTIPDLVSQLSALYQTLEARLRVFSQLYKLTGRLELVLGQIAQRQSAPQSSISVSNKPQLVFNEEE